MNIREYSDEHLAKILDSDGEDNTVALQAEAELERRGYVADKLRELMVFFKRDQLLENMENILYKNMEVTSNFFTAEELKAMLDIALKEYQNRKKDLYSIDHEKYWMPFI
jgi:hypothetical protein